MALKDSVALVTGTSTGIGAATAKALASEGTHVVVTARRKRELQIVAEQIETDGAKTAVIPADVADTTQVESAVSDTHEIFGGLDIVVNNAGTVYQEEVTDADPNEWRREMEVNLLGLMNVTRIAVSIMLEQGSGHIVNVSSMNARKSPPGGSGYGATKAGVNTFTETLRKEVTHKGIRTTVI